MPADTQQLLDELQATMLQAAQEWLRRQKEDCAKDIKRQLDQSRDQIICKMLGFEKRWSDTQWELDHCNGRAGDSAAGDFLREKVKGGVQAWLEEQAGDMPPLPPTAIKALKEEYVAAVMNTIRNELHRQAEKEGMRILGEFRLQYQLKPESIRKIDLSL